MNTTWSFILAGAVTLVSAAGMARGEAARDELSLAEAATSVSTFCEAFPGVARNTKTVASAQ